MPLLWMVFWKLGIPEAEKRPEWAMIVQMGFCDKRYVIGIDLYEISCLTR